jgi:phosphatidylinositol 4-kinase type 2
LPEKIGSMQYFLHGFTDASEFLRKHPWPGRSITDTFDDDTHRRPTGTVSRKICNTMKIVCGKTGSEEDDFDDFEDDQTLYDTPPGEDGQKPFYWTGALQRSFREELEKYVFIEFFSVHCAYHFAPRLVILGECLEEKCYSLALITSTRLFDA